MKLSSNIILRESAQAENAQFHFYNSLVLTDDTAFQRKYFKKTPKGMPQIYIPDAIGDSDDDEAPIQTRLILQNKTLLKIAILFATHGLAHETTQAIINSGAPCCVTPYLEDILIPPAPIQNTTLNEIAGGLTSLG
jgi:hypothetical protein